MSILAGITTRRGRVALLLAATSLALAGVLAAVHLATAHACPVHPGDHGQCAVCLHLQHQVAEQVVCWHPSTPERSADLAPPAARDAGSVSRPTPVSRAPPAVIL